MLGRLLVGVVKGLLLGGLLGFGLVKLGFVAPGPAVAYLAAAATGLLTGLIAGKPIWAKGGMIEAGMKAAFGAALAAGLMYAARRWLGMSLPLPLGALAAPNESLGEAEGTAGTLGGLAITSLPMIAAVLAGFFDADNDAKPEADKPAASTAAAGGKRVAAPQAESLEDDDDDADDEAERRAKK